jgi:hypothetical protein
MWPLKSHRTLDISIERDVQELAILLSSLWTTKHVKFLKLSRDKKYLHVIHATIYNLDGIPINLPGLRKLILMLSIQISAWKLSQ